MPRQIKAALFLGFIGLLAGYVIASGYLSYRLAGEKDLTWWALHWSELRRTMPELSVQAMTIMFGCAGLFGAFGGAAASQALTKVGKTNWQTGFQLRRNKLLGEPGDGIIVAKTSRPKRAGKFITYEDKPHCIVVAPSGEGKGVGFVLPNLFSFQGSTVTLDIKGENYEATARWRKKLGDEVYLFAPVEFGELSHRFNPLDRIKDLENPSERQLELEQIAGLFLQAESSLQTWLQGARDLFVVAGGVAYEEGNFTLGGIYDVIAGGKVSLKDHLKHLSERAKDPDLKRELNKFALMDEKAVASYMSVMMSAGFSQWKNGHIRRMTDVSDFSFDDIRRTRTSIYFKVAEPKLKVIAPLVRLFFNELVASMQARQPGADEPYKFLAVLDEFQALGRMDAVADAMATIRGYGGRIAVITQTIPQLDDVYDQNRRLAIQGNAGLKLYLTPSDERTVEDVSKSCGMTTRQMVSTTQRQGFSEAKTFSHRTEEVRLLSEDAARQMAGDRAVVVVNGMPPISAFRIRHFEDRYFAKITKIAAALPWEPLENALIKKIALEHQVGHKQEVATAYEKETVTADKPFDADRFIAPSKADAKKLAVMVKKVFDILDTVKLPPEERAKVKKIMLGDEQGDEQAVSLDGIERTKETSTPDAVEALGGTEGTKETSAPTSSPKSNGNTIATKTKALGKKPPRARVNLKQGPRVDETLVKAEA